MTFLQTKEDMDWLFDVHLKSRSDRSRWKSAMLTGNEDCPKEVTLYRHVNPKYDEAGQKVIDNYKPLP